MAATEVASRRVFPRLQWSAVIAGVLLALAAHIVLGLIGGAIGFAAEPADSTALGVGAAIWALITPFVATLLGAWLACRMAAVEDDAGAYLHSVLVWCIGLIAGALFLTGTMATGAMTAGTAASGNVGAVQRSIRGETGRVGGPQGDLRADEAGRAGAAGLGGAALASLAGLVGAIAGAALSRRTRSGRGWRIAIQRPEQRPGGYAEQRPGTRIEERYGESAYRGAHEQPGAGTTPGPLPRDPGSSTDPYHH